MDAPLNLPTVGDQTLFWEEAWLRLSKDGMAWVGAVVPGVREAGLRSVQLPRPGQAVFQGLPLASVFLADKQLDGGSWVDEQSVSAEAPVQGRGAVTIPSPVTGTVVAVNECLRHEPSLLASEPCGRGWIACVCLTSSEEEAAQWRPRQVVLFSASPSTGEGHRLRLESLGCQVIEASGWEALAAAISRQERDVVVLDGHSWGHQGPALVEQLLDLAPSTKVIVVTDSDPRMETAYRRHRIFYYAVEPVTDSELADVLEAAFLGCRRGRSCKAERRKYGGEPIRGFTTTHRNGQRVQLYAGPGLLRRNEGLGGQIARRLLERAMPVVVIEHDATLRPQDWATATEACDRRIFLTAEDSGLLPGSLSRQTKLEIAPPEGTAQKMVRLTIQPDASGGLDGLDPRTTSALAEHIVREMTQ